MNTVWLALLLTHGLAIADTTPTIATQNQAASAFADPPKEYRPIAWLMLNRDLNPYVLKWELEQIRHYKFGGYATYPTAA